MSQLLNASKHKNVIKKKRREGRKQLFGKTWLNLQHNCCYLSRVTTEVKPVSKVRLKKKNHLLCTFRFTASSLGKAVKHWKSDACQSAGKPRTECRQLASATSQDWSLGPGQHQHCVCPKTRACPAKELPGNVTCMLFRLALLSHSWTFHATTTAAWSNLFFSPLFVLE